MEIFEEDQVLIVPMEQDSILTSKTELESVLVEDSKTIIVNTPNNEVIYIGAVGPQGPAGVIGELQFNTLIAPTETRTLDSVNVGLVDSVLWEVTVVDRLLNRKRVTTVRGTETEGSPSYIVGPYYGASKASMLHEFDVTLVAGELILSLQNSHTNTLTAEVLRIKTNRIDF